MLPSRKKELHFFDREEGWDAPDYAAYHAGFPPPRPGSLRLEATPAYVWWPGAAARIRAYNPAIRAIFVFRDPIERAWSHWCMEWARGAETLDFEAALAAEPARLAKLRPGAARRRSWSYLDRGFYGAQVDRWLGLFPRDQLLFLSSAELAAAPVATLRRVTDFLGLPPLPRVEPLRANARKPVDYPSRLTPGIVARLRPVFRDDTARFSGLTGIDVADWPAMRSDGG